MRHAPASLPYEEPGIITILIQSSLLILLNVINSILDRTVYCGLLGQVLIGIAWGTPGAKWISLNTEQLIVQMGYLGLLLLVYEAFTGISVPIALSFPLRGLAGATSLQAFAAGAALCSTSLGTTFTVLSTSGLTATRLGVVLTSAAMMDDIVGLVMVQVIANLGVSGSAISPTTVIRPILVSLAFAIILPLACRFIVRPITLLLNSYRESHASGSLQRLLCLRQTAFVVHAAVLLGLVTGASYAGTSNLFAAYIAGAVISWWDSELPHPTVGSTKTEARDHEDLLSAAPEDSVLARQRHLSTSPDQIVITRIGADRLGKEKQDQNSMPSFEFGEISSHSTTGAAIYEHYYQQAVSKILKPFFFASIGFSIPITRMFSASIIWRGIVYTLLMAFGKLVCGLWLVRFSPPYLPETLRIKRLRFPPLPHLWGKRAQGPAHAPVPQASHPLQSETATPTSKPPNPLSLYPPSILSLAMVSRGEIGFLISSLAESHGVFASPPASATGRGDSEIFLIVTWAIVLCTIAGPLGVGLLVRRVRKLENAKGGGKSEGEAEEKGRDVLGVWGVR
ncbi:hypothetical protein K432DRAFT_441386 [Lepidopterella palustris CBS 459.81]|uniref:Cation/H+ exchanger transmembrane domain-containing protein n=1 Tax=Lepidopterella palustris CBS 459.81 TaxID=1314670 RepID=A0A8E2JHI0_9PEZI|nr:hypothetical protein K432DRAFT_441386 [Lepidopterella palustris CBS 459.81]